MVDWKGQIVTMADRAYLTEAMPMCVVWGTDGGKAELITAGAQVEATASDKNALDMLVAGNVDLLYGFELMGTPQDVIRVREGLGQFWQRQRQIPA